MNRVGQQKAGKGPVFGPDVLIDVFPFSSPPSRRGSLPWLRWHVGTPCSTRGERLFHRAANAHRQPVSSFCTSLTGLHVRGHNLPEARGDSFPGWVSCCDFSFKKAVPCPCAC